MTEAAAAQGQVLPLSRESVVSLREITQDSLRAICFLDVADDQDGLVAPNAFSIAQAHFSPSAWFRAVYADQTPVGFAMLDDHSLTPEGKLEVHNGERVVGLWRFMIDARYQRFGFGAQALRLIIAHAATRPGIDALYLSFVPQPKSAEGFYQRFGFHRTGEIDGGEVVMRRAMR